MAIAREIDWDGREGGGHTEWRARHARMRKRVRACVRGRDDETINKNTAQRLGARGETARNDKQSSVYGRL